MKKLQKLLAMMLTVVMCVGTLADTGFTVFAADDGVEDTVSDAQAEEPTEGEEEAVPGEDAVSEDAVSENETGEDALPEEGETSEDGDEDAPEEIDNGDTEYYNVWVGNVRVSSANKDDIPGVVTGDDSKVSYNPKTKTLTFENVKGFKSFHENKKSLIYADQQNLTIKGDLTFGTLDWATYGIFMNGTDYTLTLDGQIHMDSLKYSGIYCFGGINVTSNADVYMDGVEYGIYMLKQLTMDGGKLYAAGGSCGICGVYGITQNGGELETIGIGKFEDSTTKTKGGYGINTLGKLEINDGKFTAQVGAKEYGVTNEGGIPVNAYGGVKINKEKLYISSPSLGIDKGVKITGLNYLEGVYPDKVVIEADKSEKYPVWVGGVKISKNWAHYIGGVKGGYASFDAANKILTLNDVTGFEGAHNNNWIYSEYDLTVKGKLILEGEAKVDNKTVYTVIATHKGESITLDCDLDTSALTSYPTIVIHSGDDLVISGGTINARADVTGIEALKNINISSANVTGIGAQNGIIAINDMIIEDADVTGRALGVSVKDGVGITAANINIKSGSVTAAGSEIDNCAAMKTGSKSGTITIDTTKLYIATPEGGQIKNGAVCDKDGKTAYMVAIKPHEEYNVWVGSTRVTGGNADDILGNGKASYSAATKTLTLNDLRASDLEGLYTANNKTSYIYTKQDLTIKGSAVLTGMNATRGISQVSQEGGYLNIDADLTIKGTTIPILGGPETGNLIISSGAKLDMDFSSNVGIYWMKDIVINGGDIKVKGNNELDLGGFAISGLENLDIKGGKIELYGDSCAVTVNGKISLADTLEIVTPENGRLHDDKSTIVFNDGTAAQSVLIDKKVPKYTVNFYNNGHGTAPASVIVREGEKLAKPTPDPSEKDWEFTGWYMEPACINLYDFDTPVYSDMTLIAGWKDTRIKRYAVVFDLNGKGTTFAEEVEEGKTVERPANPVNSEYDFTGWYNEPECTTLYDFTTPVTDNIRIYAGWVLKQSALNPVPAITAATDKLTLVKGQKFNMPETGWTVAQESKKFVSISKKGKLTAKKVTADGQPAKITNGTRTIEIKIVQPKFNEKSYKINGGWTTDAISFNPGSEDLPVAYYSSNPNTVFINPDGMLYGTSDGSATITAYVNGKAYTTKVTCKQDTQRQYRELWMTVGSKATLKIKGVKIDKWEAADPDIVEVKGNKIKGLKSNSTYVNGTAKDGTVYQVEVFVQDPAITNTKFVAANKTATKYNITLKKGESEAITFLAVGQRVMFKSSKGEFAYVDEYGTLRAQKAGKSKITYKIYQKTYTINVTVTE